MKHPVSLGDEIALSDFKRRNVRGKRKIFGAFANGDRIGERNAVEKRQELMISIGSFPENAQIQIELGRAFYCNGFQSSGPINGCKKRKKLPGLFVLLP